LVLGGLAVFPLLLAKVSLAADASTKETHKQGTHMLHPRGGEEQTDRLVKELGLTGDKEASFRQLLREFHQSVKNWQEENASTLEKLHARLKEAREAKDEAKAKELREQIRKRVASRIVLRDNLFKKLGEILTPEQIERVKDTLIEWRARMWRTAHDLNLSEEQKTKLRQVFKNWREEMEDETVPDALAKARQSLIDKIITDVILTDAQRKALAKMTAEEPLLEKVRRLDLTKEQKAQVETLSKKPPEHGHRGRGEGWQEGEPSATTQPATEGKTK
jgi:Spy/CpxP family protein refolding chaperone